MHSATSTTEPALRVVAPRGETNETPTAADPQAAEAREVLETLDDTMFAAIGGCHASLGRARDLWSDALVKLDRGLLEESREQYLRYAVDITRRYESRETFDPVEAVAALAVIALLAEW